MKLTGICARAFSRGPAAHVPFMRGQSLHIPVQGDVPRDCQCAMCSLRDLLWAQFALQWVAISWAAVVGKDTP